ncbi:MAG TPA: hypothetical protein ENJ62_04000, partial [Bryobacterales bacterium]|nr:hypothetical protein [Bryobacterales bacterium]
MNEAGAESGVLPRENPVPEPPRPGFGNEAYLALARAVSAGLAAHRDVRTVFVRRSLAAGEIAFGRSDIDFGLVLDSALAAPGEISRLIALNRFYRFLRLFRPFIGEGLVYTEDDFRMYYVLDPFRASIDRRAAIRLRGPDIPRILAPVSPAAAIRRQIAWFEPYLTTALRRGSRRNMRKLALESWNAHAVAMGWIPEPFVTRRETEAAWRRRSGGTLPEDLREPRRAFRAICKLAYTTHRRYHAPLAPLE